MKLKNIFKKSSLAKPVKKENSQSKPEVPKGLIRRCDQCGKAIVTEECRKNFFICPKCGGYLPVPARDRINFLVENHSFEEWDTGLSTKNPLRMIGYPDRIKALQKKTGLEESVLTGKGHIDGKEVVLMVMDRRFLMGSMGQVVGEKITRGIERATRECLPIIFFTCSGGARMQEGMSSLMQMAKTSAALKRHSEAGLLSITVLTDPTTGGVTASFAMLGDIILAEPKALIGFAGPRVIEQTIHKKLPIGFQRSEFLLQHGFVDRLIERKEMKKVLSLLLSIHLTTDTRHLIPPQRKTTPIFYAETLPGTENRWKKSLSLEQKKRSKEKTAWERVMISREKKRPDGTDYIQGLFEHFLELHGDRHFGDDPAICGGLAFFGGKPVTVIAQVKGKNTRENIKRNFGMPQPEGYRKALRLMKEAEKFHRSVICFVDTPGAFCGMEAEERGQGEAIARNLYEMSSLQTPILSILIGEGGSGGALAMAVSDEVWILENAIYSILSPEGYAAILWKDSKKADRAAKAMKLTSYDLYKAGFVEKIIPEPESYTLESILPVFSCLKEQIRDFLERSRKISEEERIEKRYRRFRQM